MIHTEHALSVQRPERYSPEVVDALLAAYPFVPYRRWRGFGRDVPKALTRWRLLNDSTDSGTERWLVMDEARPVGLASLVPSSWESAQLGMTMVELRHLITVGTPHERQDIGTVLLQHIQEQLSGQAVCVVHRLDSEDYATIAALEAARFRLVDTSVSFIQGKGILPHLRGMARRTTTVRQYREEDWPAVEAIARQSFFGGRYYHDPHIPRSRSDALFLAWVRQCCQRVFADEVMLGLRADHVGGFLAYQCQRWLEEAAGIRLMGRGVLAVEPEHRGLALELIRGAILRDPTGADFIQFDSHIESVDLLGLYSRFLRMEVAHIQHVFHGWLGEEPCTSTALR